ncbi:MAG TPA: cytochrome c [Dongiaceae bacterium]|nr:cytochrome c [Dongiaceae bacterium]
MSERNLPRGRPRDYSGKRAALFRRCLPVLFLLLVLGFEGTARADTSLEIDVGDTHLKFSRQDLLNRADLRQIVIESGDGYRQPMTYKAIPLASLLSGAKIPLDSVIETVASDGFVAQLPLDLVRNTDAGKAVAYVAVEDPAQPWPLLPDNKVNPGPYRLVWLGKGVADIRSEQWPYQVIRLEAKDAPAKRWPGLAVAASVPATDVIRAGQALFVTQCLTCHRLNGAGSADIGPDLNLPMNPTEYFKPDALRRYIRNPASVRHWPAQRMPAFDTNALSDLEIDNIIAYLTHMAGRKNAAN